MEANTGIMKIIGKYKDYYDYLQGVWGQDPKAVYVRDSVKLFTEEDRPVFLGMTLPGDIEAWQGEFILTCGADEHHIYVENTGNGPVLVPFFRQRVERQGGSAPLVLEWYVDEWKRKHSRRKWERGMKSMEEYCAWAVRRAQMAPIAYERRKGIRLRGESIKAKWENPLLSSIPLTVVPAEEVFAGIQDFLLASYDMTITDNRTDVEKLEAAGFDRKTSFRNIK